MVVAVAAPLANVQLTVAVPALNRITDPVLVGIAVLAQDDPVAVQVPYAKLGAKPDTDALTVASTGNGFELVTF